MRQKLEILQNTIRDREGSCVYGSPEIIEQYGRETQRLKDQASELEMEIKALEEQ
jgi:hypothetical protein